jgi:hypothetical protein
MSIYITSKSDVGYCTIEFEFALENQVIGSKVRCPINIAEDLYCAVTLEVTIAQNLTKDKLRKIILKTFGDLYAGPINEIVQVH